MVAIKDIKTEYLMEGQLIALTIMILGVISGAVYVIGFVDATPFLKWMTGINAGAGVLLLSSFWIMTFQQLKTLKIAQNLFFNQ